MSSSLFEGYEDEDNDVFRQMIYRNADAVLLCFSVSCHDSLRNVRTKWLPEIRRFCPAGTAFSQLILTRFYSI